MTVKWVLRIILCHLYLQVCLGELKLIQTIFRHGNRMPTKNIYYPNDPYVKCTYEPEGHGGLTNKGKMSAYKLGQYFRERYGEFLGDIYTKRDILFRGDEVERVVMTGELVAAGLYPPNTKQRWNPSLNWQPIPVWTFPVKDNYLYNGALCKNYQKWRINVEQNDVEVRTFEKKNTDVYKYLSEHAGANITQDKTFHLRQYLYAQQDIGLKLPKWTKPVFPHGKLDELAVYEIYIRSRTLQMKQLISGTWIREWLQHIDNHINKNDTRKAFMYGAHELTIAAILIALDNFDNKIPSYSSTLMFELHKDNNEYNVQIYYRNQDDMKVLTFPGCANNKCSLDTFKKIVEPLIPVDKVALCNDSTIEQNTPISMTTNK